MFKVLISAAASGSGKTVATCALLAALQKRGLAPCAFKCGPDYIDPMFHRRVLGVESHNLDLFLSDEAYIHESFARYSAGHGAAVCEGAMGFYDGQSAMSTDASAWQVADVLNLPVLLVIRPGGASLTLAAQLQGLCAFRTPHHIAGILLNDCSEMLYRSQSAMLEQMTGVPVVGYLPPMKEAVFASRHLGLQTASEIADLAARIDALALQWEKSVEMERLLALCERPPEEISARAFASTAPRRTAAPRIAVARDEAFCFCYEETLDALRDAGAEIAFFSPLRDASLPENTSGLYLPGGYPELHAERLAQNEAMRTAIKRAVQAGLPTVAECGGFLYLGASLEDADGTVWPMVGALPGNGVKTDRLVRFGYTELTAEKDTMLLRAGEQTRVHEFHYWDSDANGEDLAAKKLSTGRTWRCGFANEHIYASFPHLYFAGDKKLALRFAEAAARYGENKRKKGN